MLPNTQHSETWEIRDLMYNRSIEQEIYGLQKSYKRSGKTLPTIFCQTRHVDAGFSSAVHARWCGLHDTPLLTIREVGALHFWKQSDYELVRSLLSNSSSTPLVVSSAGLGAAGFCSLAFQLCLCLSLPMPAGSPGEYQKGQE